MILNPIGKIIQSEWDKLADHFLNVQIGAFVVMPNHIHGIIVIERATRSLEDELMDRGIAGGKKLNDTRDGSPLRPMDRITPVGATHYREDDISIRNYIVIGVEKEKQNGSPRKQYIRPRGPKAGSLGAMIGLLKSRATKQIWRLQGVKGYPIWQRNYYEHIIRNASEYQRIIQYIETNPLRWAEDQLNPLSSPGGLE